MVRSATAGRIRLACWAGVAVASRENTELSGGEQQRVAVARALEA